MSELAYFRGGLGSQFNTCFVYYGIRPGQYIVCFVFMKFYRHHYILSDCGIVFFLKDSCVKQCLIRSQNDSNIRHLYCMNKSHLCIKLKLNSQMGTDLCSFFFKSE